MAELYIKDGIGIFDNKAVNADGKAAGDDLVFSIYGEHSAYTATLAERMLGGGAVKWYRDGTVYNPPPTGYTQIGPGSQRYEEGSGAVPLSSDEEAGSADIEERKDEEMAIQTLPKTGRSKDYTMFAWLFSGLILLAMVILKRIVKLLFCCSVWQDVLMPVINTHLALLVLLFIMFQPVQLHGNFYQ